MIDTAEQQGLHLPGYTLSTRLGAGGYGEVWLAHAPGGLTKAVKFVYGSFHEKRAEHELRALQRMKDLRHPFLLSLERIEVVGERLAIVTELAESSLKDRFDECVRANLRGIPRPELLKYLEDAADALDFLSERHHLQHLDVKPENLLLVAGHVKVADFGLVKDVGTAQASLMGGLTPLYSAPEVFQGNPSARSDQYSLAVLYQEMLTGALPFPGVTAAELTLQHLHDEPDFSLLPAGDRYVLARALAKDPEQRFASCGEMIAVLAAASSGDVPWGAPAVAQEGARPSDSALPERRATPRPGPVTEFFDDQVTLPRKETSRSMLLDWEPPADVEPRGMPPLQLSAEGFAGQPTVVIGIGGQAQAVLRSLRGRLVQRFGDEPLPAVQLLLLDSDPKAVVQAMQGDSRSALSPEETLALPLRRPQEYREQSARLMRWLSRRWLYNIPKSLRTEGLRPLGRLAFADHARQAVQRLRMALAQAMDAEALRSLDRVAPAAERRGAMRVYVVASASGGAGSGMSLDVGFAVRAALEKAGAAQAQVIGVFLQSGGRDVRQCDLARVNAYAWLTEYNHFHRAGSAFPGDESSGLPPLPPGRRAFDYAYLVEVGAAAEPPAFDQAAQAVAEYIFADALTPAQRFFDQCRRDAASQFGEFAPLRTFRLEKVNAVADCDVEAAAAAVGREVLLQWAGGTEPAARPPAPGASLRDTDQIVQGAATLVSRLQLKLDGLASNARALIDGQFGGDQQTFLAGLIDVAQRDGRLNGPGDALRLIDGLFAATGEHPNEHCFLQRPVDAIVSPLSMKLAGDLYQWVLNRLDDRQERLAGAQRAVNWLIDHLTSLEADAVRLGAALNRQIGVTAEAELRAPSSKGLEDDTWQRSAAYFRMRVDQLAVTASAQITRLLLAKLKSVGATLAEFGRHLKHLAASTQSPTPAGGASAMQKCLHIHLPRLIEAIDQQMQDQFIAPNGGLFQTVMGSTRLRSEMLAMLSRLARRSVEQFACRADVLRGALQARLETDRATDLPKFLQHGGAYRSLVIAPPDSGLAEGAARRVIGAPSTLAHGGDVVVCYEAWDLPLPTIAVDLIHRRRDYADFAARVASRSDVAWTSLTAPAVAQCGPPVAGAAAAP
ncbi:MAG: protein kinase [Pirellulales bacterium]|nr:protein kinase [Pirellulales bacterium]